MATLTADTALVKEYGEFNDIPCVASDIVYEGSAVGDNASGYARPLVAGDPFRGHCVEQCDNSSGSAGDKNVKVLTGTYLLEVTLASVAITDVGKKVYMSDDATYTLTAASYSFVGYVHRYVTTNTCIVKFVVQDNRSKHIMAKAADFNVEAVDDGCLFLVDCSSAIVTATLPAAEIGLEFSFAVTDGTYALRIDPDGSEYINAADGSASSAAGDYLENEGANAAGDHVRVKCVEAGVWQVFDAIGTWTEE